MNKENLFRKCPLLAEIFEYLERIVYLSYLLLHQNVSYGLHKFLEFRKIYQSIAIFPVFKIHQFLKIKMSHILYNIPYNIIYLL